MLVLRRKASLPRKGMIEKCLIGYGWMLKPPQQEDTYSDTKVHQELFNFLVKLTTNKRVLFAVLILLLTH